MPTQRRCLVPGCDCRGYTLEAEAYSMADDEEDLIESEKEELPSYCVICGHPEEEHELTVAD